MGDERWQRGARIGVDVGAVRIGVAICDPEGILATPLTTVPRAAGPTMSRGGRSTAPRGRGHSRSADIATLADLVREHAAVEVVVGLPVNLAGRDGPAAAGARAYAARLAAAIAPVPVHLFDERLTTVVASRRLSERGVRGRRARAVVDQAAAVEILQGWLDARRRRT